ncbi:MULTISPECIES: ABC transporter ATP-binding protein [unclassified Streptomyces]|uniref:ABC transporter ATP-binding protein n=1 Tax=unclassified Streptomyces TaxID=2593676 RepID=UPI002E2CBC7E|nr:ATP-binding cassette domain-containing protein [Streptomyces sp. NBC_00273]
MPATQLGVELRTVSKTYRHGPEPVVGLDRVSLVCPFGVFTAIMGPAGSGKSTLLRSVAGLERADSGQVRVDGTALGSLDEAELTALRNKKIGYVAGPAVGARAVAQTLAALPAVFLADEPTGALDAVSSRQVLTMMRNVTDDAGRAVVMATSDPTAAAYADQVILLSGGRVAATLEFPTTEEITTRLAALHTPPAPNGD